MNFTIKNLARSALAASAVFLTTVVSTAQQAVLTGTTDWLGTTNSDYFNASNWTNGVPTGQTDIRLLSESANKNLNIKHEGTGTQQVDIYSIRAGSNYNYTLNLESTSTGTLTLNITGRGTHPFNTDGNSTSTGNAANRLNFTINMGNNTRITFADDIFDAGGVPLAARDTSGLLYTLVNMTGNAVIDARDIDNLITISSTGVVSWSGCPRFGGFNIGRDAVVYMGMSTGHLSAAIGAGQQELWEGLLVQDAWDPAKLRADLYGVALPDGITREMLTVANQNTQKWGTGITRVTTTGTVLHPGNFTIRGAGGGYVVDGYHRGPITFNVSGANGGYVGGIGHIEGNVTVTDNSTITGGDRNGGTAMYRNPIGTLTITGTLSLNGSLSIDLADYGQGDKIKINGNMDIGPNGKLTAGWTSGTVPIRTGTNTFRVVEVTGGAITGDFASVSLPQKLRQQATYDLGPDYLDIIFVGYETFGAHPNIAGSYNYKSIAGVLDTVHMATVQGGAAANDFSAQTKALVEEIYTAFDALPSLVYVQQAMDQLIPVAHQSWFPSAVLRTNSMVQSVENRMLQDAAYGRASGSTQTYLQGWRQESSRQADEYAPYSNYDTHAVFAGADYAFAENIVAGGYLAYETTKYDIDLSGGEGDAKSYTLGAYIRYSMDKWQFNATAFYGTDSYTASRDISLTPLGSLARADTDGSRLGMAVSAAYTYKHPWVDIVPVAGLQWLNWKADGFTETGGRENLAVHSQSETSMQARLGVRFTRAFESSRGFIRPYLHAAYIREFQTGERKLTADIFESTLTIKAPGIEANGMRVDAGVEWQLSKAWRFDVHYTAQYNGASDESVGVRGGVTFSF